MHERIKKLRRALGLTQQEFADRLNIGRGTLANYEVGRNEPIDAVIALICREFNVNEKWLRTGEGGDAAMFVQQTKADELAAAMDRFKIGQSAEFKRRLVVALSTLKEEHWLLLEEKLKEIVGAQEAAPTIEQEADAVAASVHDQYIMEKKAEAESSVSPSNTGHADAEQMA